MLQEGVLGCSEPALEEEDALRTLSGVLLPAGCSPRQSVPSGPDRAGHLGRMDANMGEVLPGDH